MEKGRKTKAVADSKSEQVKSEITFDLFFEKCVREGKLKSWQRMEIEAFFKDHKLREKEDSKIYADTLAKYYF
jgi:hypothetical protein